MIEVRRYQRLNSEVPLTDWLAGMRDARARAKLEVRFRRVSMGIFGDIKPVGDGVLELREDIGPGYRVYLGGMAQRSSSCSAAATNARRMRTSNGPWNTGWTGNGETHEQS